MPDATSQELDPGIRAFIDTVHAESAAFPDPHGVPYAESRRSVEQVRRRWREGGPAMDRVVDLEVPGRAGPIRVRLYDPSPSRGKAVLVYLHGGGWTFFSIETHDRVMREYAARADVAVIGVEYALSPEAKFPTALHQVVDVLRWAAADSHRMDVDGSRLAVGGDSAGANLALAAALMLREAGQVALLRALVLNYGAWDARCSDAAIRQYGGPGYMLESAEMDTFWRNYARDASDYANPLVCPLRADVAGLPMTFMAIPQCDLLTEQNQMMAVKLQAAGVPVRAVVYDGASHSFLEAVSVSEVSVRAFDDTAAWLRRALA